MSDVLEDLAEIGALLQQLGAVAAARKLERVAKEWGSALGVAGDASPVLLDRITSWATGLEQRGIVLAPVTAILRRPEIPQKETAAR